MEDRADMTAPQNRLDRIESPTGDILGEAGITVDVPVAVAFKFWRHFENLAEFMQHVSKVEAVGVDRYTWTVDGPLGTSVSWEAITTRLVENETISWQSVEGSEITNSGSVHFTPTPTGGTDIRVKLAYTPPAGKVGHFVASLLGKNPEQQINDDLKTLQGLLCAGATEGAMPQADSAPHQKVSTM